MLAPTSSLIVDVGGAGVGAFALMTGCDLNAAGIVCTGCLPVRSFAAGVDAVSAGGSQDSSSNSFNSASKLEAFGFAGIAFGATATAGVISAAFVAGAVFAAVADTTGAALGPGSVAAAGFAAGAGAFVVAGCAAAVGLAAGACAVVATAFGGLEATIVIVGFATGALTTYPRV